MDASPHVYSCVFANIAIPINYMIAEYALTTDKPAIAAALRTEYQMSHGVLKLNYPPCTRSTPHQFSREVCRKTIPIQLKNRLTVVVHLSQTIFLL
jgi:hypothetical protein